MITMILYIFLNVITICFGEIEKKIKNICKNKNKLNDKHLIYISKYINIIELDAFNNEK